MNWDTDWKRVEQQAWEELWFLVEDVIPDKTYAIRSAILALIAWAATWAAFFWLFRDLGRWMR